ncbi:putative inorganic phosphate cotransporter [Halyomorpha halys]|uniref:putative inorganic phosphate cotransporter n=1 Tax=Halyomorpha halys TaxID=286706 RepID=UPI0006D4D380|nr:putative inorganic phosphate cotransporter [Halyomorpha halys]
MGSAPQPSSKNEKSVLERQPSAEDKPSGLGVRHLQALLLFFCITVNYLMRVNLSVGIVLMTQNSTTNSTSDIPVFDWTMKEKSVVHSSFFFGYLFMNLAAAVIVTKINNKFLLLGSVTISSAVTIATPALVIFADLYMLIVIRIVLGFMQGFMMACVMGQMSRWIPPAERSRCGALVLGGVHFGTIVSFATSGVLGTKFGGWPTVFYFSGSLGVIWVLVWAMIGAESPNSCRYIGTKERDYIVDQLSSSTSVPKNITIPWKEMLKSKACIALALVTLGHNWGFWTLVTEMPSYFSSVLKFDSTTNGYISAVPFASLWIFSFPASYIADVLVKKNIISVTISRKGCNTIAHWGAAAALTILTFTTNNTLVIMIYTIGVTLMGFSSIGYNINHLDIVPNFAGFLMGITNGLSNFSSILAPQFVGLIVTDPTNAFQWKIVFWVSALIFFLGNLIFITMGKATVQPFNEIPEDIKTPHKKMSVASICSRP